MQSIKAIRLMATIDDCVSIALLIDPKDELLQALANLRLQGCIQGLGPGSLGLFGRQANVDLADLGMGEKSDRKGIVKGNGVSALTINGESVLSG